MAFGITGLNDFFINLGRLSDQRKRAFTGRQSMGLNQHIVHHNDFIESMTAFTLNLPDPDEILKNAGLTTLAYRDVLTDAHVGAVIQQRKTVTKQSLLSWSAGIREGEEKASNEAERAKMEVEMQFDAIFKKRPLIDINAELLDAPIFGMSPMELFWTSENGIGSLDAPNGRKILTNIIQKPYEWFGYDKNDELGIKFRITENFILREIRPGKIINIRYNPTYRNPYGDRFIKRMFWPWKFKKMGFTFWTEFIEKYGMPFLHGVLAPDKNPDDLKRMLDDLLLMSRNGAMASLSTDSGQDKVDVVESKGRQGSTDAHDKFIVAQDLQISKAGLSETLTIENRESGSQAATKIHENQLKNIQREDRILATTFYAKASEMITRANFGPEVPAPVPLLTNETELQQERTERDTLLTSKHGVVFRKNYYVENYGYDDNDFDLTKGQDALITDDNEPESPLKPINDNNQKVDDTVNPADTGKKKFDDFQERQQFPIQNNLDKFLQFKLKELNILTEPQINEVRKIMVDSKDYNEFMVNIMRMEPQFNKKVFNEVFGQTLDIFSLVGLHAVTEDEI